MRTLYIRTMVAALGLLLLGTASFGQSFKLPAYEKVVLKNGLTIYLMEQHEVPMLAVSAIFDAGAVYDPAGKNGLATATADALLFGAGDLTKEQIEEKLDFVGASIGTGAGQETASVTANFAKKDEDLVLGILQKVITQPRFNAEDVTDYRDRTLVQLQQAKESPRRVIRQYWNGFLYAGHPYANPTTGTPEGYQSLDRAQLEAFYAQKYLAGNAAIAVVGDFKTAEMKAKLTTLFGNWQTAKPNKMARVPSVNLNFDGPRVLLVDKPDARETTFYIGGKGIERSNPDFVAVFVVNTVLGGRFTSWLNDELRVNTGLTYGANSSFSTSRNGGTFVISSFTKVSSTAEAIDLALVVLDSLHRKGIDAATLQSAKNYVKGDYPPNYESADDLSRLLTSMFAYGFDERFINEFQKNVDGLTVERAREIVKTYFPKENLQFVLVGKAAEIRELAKKYGPVTEKLITTPGF